MCLSSLVGFKTMHIVQEEYKWFSGFKYATLVPAEEHTFQLQGCMTIAFDGL